MRNVNKLKKSPTEASNLIKGNSEKRLWADENLFSSFMKSFWDKEEYRCLLSSFLENSKDFLWKIWDIKIDVNHIKKFESNKSRPDISKESQEKIARLYLNKLYSACIWDTSLILKLNKAFEINMDIDEEKVDKDFLKKIKKLVNNDDNIDSKTKLRLEKLCNRWVLDHPLIEILTELLGEETVYDLRAKIRDAERTKQAKLGGDANLSEIRTIIGKKDIDFEKLKIYIDKLWAEFDEKLNSTTISNLEIFHSLNMKIKHNSDFSLQDPSLKDDVLNLLQFETTDINEYVKLWWEKLWKDMMDAVLPLNNVSDIFNAVDDSKISGLKLMKSYLEEILLLDEKELKLKWDDYVDDLEKKWIPNIEDLKEFLSWRMEFSVLKKHIRKTIELVDKQIWRNYVDAFEKSWSDSEFVQVLWNLYFNQFDVSKLDFNEQTILWQNLVTNKFDDENSNSRLKYTGLDQEWYKDFLKDLYDFEKDDLSIDVSWVWELNLKIKKEVKKIERDSSMESDVQKKEKPIEWERSTFSNIENLSDLDERNPLVFTVNIDDNDENLIKDLEETQDSPLRSGWIMETHTVKWWKLNIWNGYTLGICGKEITKSQLDELLNYSYFTNDKLDEKIKAFDDLNGKLRDLWLYDEIKDLVDPIKNKILSNQDYFSDNWRAQNNDQWCWQFCIFEEVLKKLDVKVIKRDLIFEWKDINKLSQLYLMAKLHWNWENKQIENDQDDKVIDLFSRKDSNEKEEWKLKRLLNISDLSLFDFPLKIWNKVSIWGEKCEYLWIDNWKLVFKPDNWWELKEYSSFKELKDAWVNFDLKSRQELWREQQGIFDELVQIEELQKRKKELEEKCKNLELEINGLSSDNEDGKNDDVVAEKKTELDQAKSELNNTNKVLDAYRNSGEKKESLWWREKWEEYADEIFEEIKTDVEEYSDMNDSIISDDTEKLLKTRWDSLDNEWKQSFKDKLYNLIDDYEFDDYRINKEDLKEEIEDVLGGREDSWATKAELEKKLGIEEKLDKEKTEEEKFQEVWQSFSGDEKCVFEVGTRLYFDLWESQLPPKGTTSYYCFEIVDVWKDEFTLKAIWGELKSSLKNKTWSFSRTADSLLQLKEWWTVFKVWSIKWKDRDSCVKNISNSKFFGDNGNLNIFWEWKWKIQLKWDKFVKEIDENWEKKEVEVKYFHGENFWFDDEAWKQWQKKYKYEIKKIDTSKWTVKFVANFSDYNEKGEPTKYACENELTYEQFILLIEWKSLLWASKEEQDAIDTKYKIDDPWRSANKWNRKWISIWAIINVVKNWRKAFDAKMDERKKEQEENLDNFLFSYEWLNLWNKIWWFADMMWLHSVWSACNELYYDFYTNRENRTWKKIDKRYKLFEGEPNYSECYKEVLLPILKEPWCKMYADDYTRYRFAAAFLLMLKNEWPYPRDFWWDLWKWVWVEKFLWSWHAQKFRKFYDEKKLEIERVKNLWYSSDVILAKQEELNKMEITYIISIIDGLAPYNDWAINEFESKSIWWLKFKDKLNENFSWYFDKHNETKNKMSTFFAAEEQYLRTIWAGRFNKALPSLERMCEKAESPEEAFRTKWYLLSAMLMWIVKNNSSASTIKSFFNTCRSMWFAPWSWMKDADQQRKVQILLDWATNGEFSKDQKLKYNISDFNPWAIKDGKYWFVKKFESYWNANWEKILKKIEKPSYKDKNNPKDRSIMEMAADDTNPNKSVFVEYVSNSRTIDYDTPNWEVWAIWEKTAPWTAISNKIRRYIPSKWYYSNLTKEEEKDDAKEFWKKAAREIPTGKVDKITTEDTFMRFFSWFDTRISSVRKPIIRSLKLVQKLKAGWFYGDVDYILSYLIRWNMHRETWWTFPSEFENVVENFRKFFINNVESIDDGIIRRTFENDGDLVDEFEKGEDMIMFNCEDYIRYKMNNYRNSGGWSSDRSKYIDYMQFVVRKKNYENRNNPNYRELTLERDVINTEIENIWRQCNTYWSPEVDGLLTAGYRINPLEDRNTIRDKLGNLTELENMA